MISIETKPLGRVVSIDINSCFSLLETPPRNSPLGLPLCRQGGGGGGPEGIPGRGDVDIRRGTHGNAPCLCYSCGSAAFHEWPRLSCLLLLLSSSCRIADAGGERGLARSRHDGRGKHANIATRVLRLYACESSYHTSISSVPHR
jgi:hypothetical protein